MPHRRLVQAAVFVLSLLPLAANAGKHHTLKATPDSVAWGWLDPKQPPQLTIESGDTVSIETLMHAKDGIQKGVSMEKITIPIRPFPGTLALGIDPEDPSPRKGEPKLEPGAVRPPRTPEQKLAPVSSLRPWKNGSNMDINELVEGSTLYLPVFQEGGLIWTGDSHCAQGNGEVNLTAMECSFEEIELQPIVRKDLKLTWPRIETKTHYIQVGFDEDLNKAFTAALRETIDFLVTEKKLDRYDAYGLAAVAADCRVSQVVDVRKGVHCMVPKSLWAEKKAAKASKN